MRRSAQWYREQSERAEREWQRAVWGRAAPRGAPAPAQSAAQKIFPHLATGRTVEIARRDVQSAPDSIASRVYPHLPREGGE
jgi:hypothetical protein